MSNWFKRVCVLLFAEEERQEDKFHDGIRHELDDAGGNV